MFRETRLRSTALSAVAVDTGEFVGEDNFEVRNQGNWWHFMPEKYLAGVIDHRSFHFKNARGQHEHNVLVMNGHRFSPETIGYLSFTQDPYCLTSNHFWRTYADDGQGVAVGFRQAGWRQDYGPIATGNRAFALKNAGREVSNLYLYVRDGTDRLRKCYYSMVFYDNCVDREEDDLEEPGNAEVQGVKEISLTLKPGADSPDAEERLLVLGCAESLDLDFSPMAPYMAPTSVVMGYRVSVGRRQEIASKYRGSLHLMQASIDIVTDHIVIESAY